MFIPSSFKILYTKHFIFWYVRYLIIHTPVQLATMIHKSQPARVSNHDNSPYGTPSPMRIHFLHSFIHWHFPNKGGNGSGVDSGGILGFAVGPGSGVKNLWKKNSEWFYNFSSRRSLRGHFLSENKGKFMLNRWY